MPEIVCVSCGALIPADAAFCVRCGTPRQDAVAHAAPSVAEPAPAPYSGKDFEFTAGALGLFGRFLLLGVGLVLIVPAPWLVCWFYEWLIGHVRGDRGARLTFRGTPGSVWILTTLYGLLIVGGSVAGRQMEEAEVGAQVAYQVVYNLGSIVLGWAFLRWLVGALAYDGNRLRLTARLLPYIGWTVAYVLSIFTIIGWAWVVVAWYRWIAGTVEGAPGQFTLVAKGHEFLWRSVASLLFCIPVLTIPWAIRWFLAWIIEQFRMEDPAAAPRPDLYKTQEL